MKGKKTRIGKSDRQTYRKRSLLLALVVYHPSVCLFKALCLKRWQINANVFLHLFIQFFYFNSLCFNSHLLGTDKLPVLTGTNAFRK